MSHGMRPNAKVVGPAEAPSPPALSPAATRTPKAALIARVKEPERDDRGRCGTGISQVHRYTPWH